MRLWIITQFYPPDMGAAAVRLSRLARLLAQDGHEVIVLTVMPHYTTGTIPPPYQGKLFVREVIDGVAVLRTWLYATPDKGSRARILNQISAMIAVAVRGTFARRPDAILLESHPLFMVIAGGWLKRFKAAPILLNVSDLWPESAVATGALRADSALVRWATRVERWAYGDAAQIVGMTEAVAAGIITGGGDAHKVTLITNGVDLERFHPDHGDGVAFRARIGIPADQVIAAHIGNMSLTYDFELILAAAGALPTIAFVFIGGGSQEATVRARVTALGLSNVYFTGALPHDEMPNVWHAADICLIALGDHSLAAGTRPAKLYEAFATGTPVVAAIRGEGAALLSESGGGRATPVGDAPAYIAAIRDLVDDLALRTRTGRAGRAYAEAYFSPDRVKQAYLALLEQVTR